MAGSVKHVFTDHLGRQHVQRLVTRKDTAPRRTLVLLSEGELEQAKTLAIRRDMGIGDLLMLTPTLRALKQRHPQLAITLYCCSQFMCLFDGNDDLSAVRPLDQYAAEAASFDLSADLMGWAERSPVRDCLDRTSIFAKAFDLSLDDGFPIYRPTVQEMNETSELLMTAPRPWVAIAPLGSERRRCWEPANLNDFCARFYDETGGTLFPVHHNRDLDGTSCFRSDRCQPLWAVPLRQLFAILARMDCVVSVDTGIFHAAAAASGYKAQCGLVVLFGSVKPRLRTNWYNEARTEALWAPQACEHCPCDSRLGFCPHQEAEKRLGCMKALTGEMVMAAVRRMVP